MDKRTLALFQICDSSFPTGAFSHSFGLETYIQAGSIHDKATFIQWLQVFVREQLIYSDGLACLLAYEALEKENLDEIWRLDRKLTVQALARETREGNQRIGQQMLQIVEALYQPAALLAYKERLVEKRAFGHPAIVFAIIGHHLTIPKSEMILYYLYSAVSGLVQNAVRAIPLGQTDGQRILHVIQDTLSCAQEEVLQLSEDDFGIVAPGLELAQMHHERVNIRIFMS